MVGTLSAIERSGSWAIDPPSALALHAGLHRIDPAHRLLRIDHAARAQGLPIVSHLYHEKIDADSCWLLEEALNRNKWNQTRAAEELGLQRTASPSSSGRSRIPAGR